ncbi:MAG: ThuA domain-containing protein [Deltaproteobacteria bacterium]|nr:ThuA domain-containing protein [Deltaproteobacteria bacterium]
MDTEPVRVVVWDEHDPHIPSDVYPKSIRGAIASGLGEFGRTSLQVSCAHIDQAEQGLCENLLEQTDVLIWWGHKRHAEVSDLVSQRIVERVRLHGMGFIALHSAHYSKPFRNLLGCSAHLRGGWNEEGQTEEIRVCAPTHPIATGLEDFSLPDEEFYGVPFEVPPAEAVVFQSWFSKSRKHFPSGIVWTVGQGIDPDKPITPQGQGDGIGRVFYFRPGHETVPTYFNSNVQRILYNASRWAAKRD